MKKIGLLFLFVAGLSLAGMMSGCSTFGTQPQIKADVVMKAEDTVRLFHKGTVKANTEFCVDETVPVYRYYGRYLQSKEVGKVKIVKFIEDNYLEAVVVEGEIKDGDVAKKSSATCLVQLPERKEK